MKNETKAFLDAALREDMSAQGLAALFRQAELVEDDPTIAGKFEFLHQKLRAWQRESVEEQEAQRKTWQAARSARAAMSDLVDMAERDHGYRRPS